MRLIIFEEKNAKRYFDASTPGRLDQACRFILQERLNAGMYDVGDFPVLPENLKEKNNPDSEKKEEYKKHLDFYHKNKKLKSCVENLLKRKSELVERQITKEILPESFLLLLEYSSREQHAVYLENIKPLS